MKFTAELIINTSDFGVAFSKEDNQRMVKFFNKALGKRIFATLETETKSRSNNQNRYYWGVVIDLLSEHTGFTAEEMHEILKHKFLRRTVWVHKKDGTKEQSIITKSTTDLSTKEMEDYLIGIRMWSSADLGIFLPAPNEAFVL